MPTNMTPPPRSPTAMSVIALLLIATVSLGIRIYNLDSEPLHVDEMKQVQEVQEPWDQIVELSYRHAQPPLDYLIGKATVSIAAATDFSQRLPSAVFGGLAIGLAALMLVRLGMPIAAIAAGTLAAIHPLLIHYSQYARPYALPLFLVMGVLAIYQHWRLGARKPVWVAAFAIVASLALVSRALMPLIALGVLGVIALGVGLVRTRWDLRASAREDPLAIVVLPIVFGLVWIPNFVFGLNRFANSFLSGDDYDLVSRLEETASRIAHYGERALRPLPLILLGALFLGSMLIPQVRTRLRSSWYVWIPTLATGPLFALAHSLTTREGQFFADRYMIFLPLGVSLAIGVVLEGIWHAASSLPNPFPWLARIGLLAAALVLLAIPAANASKALLQTEVMADWQSVGSRIQAVEDPGDVIIAIDTRPFRRGAWNFGFVSKPRYYSGNSPDLRPDEVALGPANEADSAERYHFVLFSPKLNEGGSLPDNWTTVEFTGMLVATTPTLRTDSDRLEAWWEMSKFLRGDVSIMTRLGGLGLARRFDAGESFPWVETIRLESSRLGLEDLAEDWMEKVGTSAGGP